MTVLATEATASVSAEGAKTKDENLFQRQLINTPDSLKSTFRMHMFKQQHPPSLAHSFPMPESSPAQEDDDCGAPSMFHSSEEELHDLYDDSDDDDSADASNSYLDHDDGSSCLGKEIDAVNKLITLQSIDRLENHIPYIVAQQLLNDMIQKRELAKQHSGNLSFLGRGAMTLEVAIPSVSTPSETATADETATATMDRRVSTDSTKSMNDLLHTLTSLDELLIEEFSSEEESSSEEDSEDDSEDDIEDDDDSSSDASCDCVDTNCCASIVSDDLTEASGMHDELRPESLHSGQSLGSGPSMGSGPDRKSVV